MFPRLFWIAVAVSAVMTLCGFFKTYIWFMAIGYGLAVMGIGAALLICNLKALSMPLVLLCVLIMVYGFRLGGFLLLRELKSASYKENMKKNMGEKDLPIFVKVFMWIYVSFEYPFQTSAAIYRFSNGAADNGFLWVGMVIMAFGIIIEAMADKQKSAQKAANPHRFADQGLFKLCRCPNYFGEITFWLGLTLSGIGAVKGAQWIIVVIGFILILYVMMSGAKRLEVRHEKNYGSDLEYVRYSNSTPLIFPLIPLYHLKDVSWIK